MAILDDIIGMDDAISQLCDTLDFMGTIDFRNSEITFSKGCILIGHPGCGKTMLMTGLKERFVQNGNYRLLMGNKGNMGGSAVSKVTQSVESFFEPVHSFPEEMFLILIDEIEQVLVSKDNRSVLSTELTTAVNMELSGLDSCKNLYVIGTTNYPQKMDAASVRSGRLDETIYIKDPEYLDRVKLVNKYFGDMLDICDFNEKFISKIALNTPGFNGSDFNKIAGSLFKQFTIRRVGDKLYRLNSQHVHEEVAKLSLLKDLQRNGFKEFWIEACNCIDL